MPHSAFYSAADPLSVKAAVQSSIKTAVSLCLKKKIISYLFGRTKSERAIDIKAVILFQFQKGLNNLLCHRKKHKGSQPVKIDSL